MKIKPGWEVDVIRQAASDDRAAGRGASSISNSAVSADLRKLSVCTTSARRTSGIGRTHNIALSTFAQLVLPGDVSAGKRCWQRDVITPPVEVTAGGSIHVGDSPGFGYALDTEYLESLVIRREVLV